MIEVDITASMRNRAKYYARKLGQLHNSITKGEGNTAGYLGEFAYLETFSGTWTKDDRDYDLITSNDLYADVKTKRCKSKPKLNYECSVANYNAQQDCDIYIFTRVQKDYTKCWLLGWMETEKYFDLSVFLKEGEIDPSNGWKVRCDCYNLSISDLNEFTEEFI